MDCTSLRIAAGSDGHHGAPQRAVCRGTFVIGSSRRWPIDVRAPRERDQKYIAGSLGIPLNHLVENLEKLPKDRPLLVYCAGGYRSSIAASLLQRGGFREVSEIAGGIVGWETAKLPVQTGPAPS